MTKVNRLSLLLALLASAASASEPIVSTWGPARLDDGASLQVLLYAPKGAEAGTVETIDAKTGRLIESRPFELASGRGSAIEISGAGAQLVVLIRSSGLARASFFESPASQPREPRKGASVRYFGRIHSLRRAQAVSEPLTMGPGKATVRLYNAGKERMGVSVEVVDTTTGAVLGGAYGVELPPAHAAATEELKGAYNFLVEVGDDTASSTIVLRTRMDSDLTDEALTAISVEGAAPEWAASQQLQSHEIAHVYQQ